eukprot:15431845-Alexandrium_andersonii.AAC.1
MLRPKSHLAGLPVPHRPIWPPRSLRSGVRREGPSPRCGRSPLLPADRYSHSSRAARLADAARGRPAD